MDRNSSSSNSAFKFCIKCKETKSTTEFPPGSYGTLHSYCRPCKYAYDKIYKDKNRERYNANSKAKKRAAYEAKDPSLKRKYWTYDKCLEAAKQCQTVKEFYEKFKNVYQAAVRRGYLDKLIVEANLKRTRRCNNFWTKEEIAKEALKYKFRNHFCKMAPGAYAAASKGGFLEEVCSHMSVVGNRMSRALYAFEHPDKTVYVGLTYNYGQRYEQHMRNNKLLIKKQKEGGQIFKTFDVFYPAEIASKEENKLIEKYKEEGWIILNKAKAGALGGDTKKWTTELIKQEALKYSTRTQFQKGSVGAYAAAYKLGIFEEVTSHMPEKVVHRGEENYGFKWSYLALQEEALKYSTRTEFQKGSLGAYTAAYKRGILDIVCSHMEKLTYDWTLEEIKQEALKYKKRSEFQKNNSAAYSFAQRREWIDEVCSHMEAVKNIPYSEEELVNIALQFDNLQEFREKEPAVYAVICKRGIKDKLISHMKRKTRDWTLLEVKEEALKYKTRTEFQKNSSAAYSWAHKRDLLDDVCAHMPKRKPKPKIWTPESIKMEALKYSTRKEFRNNGNGAYSEALRLGIADEACKHMIFLGRWAKKAA